MANAPLNQVFNQLPGQVGRFVFGRVHGKLVVSAAADWSRR